MYASCKGEKTRDGVAAVQHYGALVLYLRSIRRTRRTTPKRRATAEDQISCLPSLMRLPTSRNSVVPRSTSRERCSAASASNKAPRSSLVVAAMLAASNAASGSAMLVGRDPKLSQTGKPIRKGRRPAFFVALCSPTALLASVWSTLRFREEIRASRMPSKGLLPQVVLLVKKAPLTVPRTVVPPLLLLVPNRS